MPPPLRVPRGSPVLPSPMCPPPVCPISTHVPCTLTELPTTHMCVPIRAMYRVCTYLCHACTLARFYLCLRMYAPLCGYHTSMYAVGPMALCGRVHPCMCCVRAHADVRACMQTVSMCKTLGYKRCISDSVLSRRRECMKLKYFNWVFLKFRAYD